MCCIYICLITLTMSNTSTYELYKKLDDENIIMSFKGVVTGELLTSMLHIMELKLRFLDEQPKIKKKVFNVLVECLQNLYHHTEANLESMEYVETVANSALVVIIREGNTFMVRTGNFIEKSKIEKLEKRLEEINSLDEEGLKLMYRENLKNSQISAKGTAGLGMIDIARKSGNKLDYQFLSVNEHSCFFSLNVKID